MMESAKKRKQNDVGEKNQTNWQRAGLRVNVGAADTDGSSTIKMDGAGSVATELENLLTRLRIELLKKQKGAI